MKHYERIQNLDDACRVLISEVTKISKIPLHKASIDFENYKITIERNQVKNDNSNNEINAAPK